jgi:hypothetical protein
MDLNRGRSPGIGGREGSYAYSLRRGGILCLLIDVRLQDPFSFLKEIFTYIR